MAVAPYDLEPDDDSRWQELAEAKETISNKISEFYEKIELIEAAANALEELTNLKLDWVKDRVNELDAMLDGLYEQREFELHRLAEIEDEMEEL